MEKAIAYLEEHGIAYHISGDIISLYDPNLDFKQLSKTLLALSNGKAAIVRTLPCAQEPTLEKAIDYLQQHNIAHRVTERGITVFDKNLELLSLTKKLQALSPGVKVSRPLPELSRMLGKALLPPVAHRKAKDKGAR